MIIAKVATVLDNRTVVINVGSAEGVKLNMKFLISTPVETSVTDPDTGKVLGTVSIPKVRVKATRVDQAYTVCETYNYREVNKGGSFALGGDNLRKLLEPQRYVREYETFEIEDEDRKALDEKNSKVKVGDLVEQIQE